MSYRFIMGGSGSGKTHYVFSDCIAKSLENEKENYIVIVPEQQTMQTQKDLVTMHPRHAISNIDVVSFNRLAYRIFHELGIQNPDVIDDIGKTMIIRKVAFEKKKELKVFANQFSKAGFIDHMKSMISEFFQYGVDVEKIRELLKQDLRPTLRSKLQDMEVIYSGFQEFIAGKYITTEEILDVLSRVIYRSKIIDGAHIVLDGFTGFTPVQLRIIDMFLSKAEDVTITVTVPTKEEAYSRQEESDLFLMSKAMVAEITDLAAKNGICHEEDVIFSRPYKRFLDEENLAHLEEHFLRYDRTKKMAADGHIRMVRATNPMSEIRVITGEILRLVKEEGYRFCEIAVIMGDMNVYKEDLMQRLDNCEIPYYMDDNISISDNPLVDFLRAALNVIAEGYSYESVMHYVRSCMVERPKKLIWMMDNYMLSRGIKSYKAMEKQWDYVPRSLKGINIGELNAFKDSILEELLPLKKVFSEEELTANKISAAIFAIFEKLGIEERCVEMAKGFQEADAKDLQRARGFEAVYDKVMDLLEQMGELLGDEKLKRKEFLELLNAGIAQVKVGMIPAAIDRIILGDLTRTRLSHIRAIFFLGINEGSVPASKDRGTVLNDREKQMLKDWGVALSPTIKEDVFIQRFYLYLMLTKQSHYLFLTYAGASNDGKALRPSGILHLVQELFLHLEVEEDSQYQSIRCSYEAREALIESLRQIQNGEKSPNLFQTLYHYVEESKSLVDAATYVYREKGLSREVAQELFGRQLSGSVTRIEEYINCPYAHFLKYGLELSPRDIRRFAAVDIGNLVHEVMEKVFALARKKRIRIQDMEDGVRDALVEECVQAAKLDDEHGIYSDSAKSSYQVERILALAKRSMWVLQQQLRRGKFEPYAFEQKFDGLQSLTADLGEGRTLKLRGKIDRVDICENGDDVLVKIVDYKTGSTEWAPDLTYYGTQIQLVLYLSAMEDVLRERYQGKNIVPGAMFYHHLDDVFVEAQPKDSKEAIDAMFLKTLRPSGLVNTDMEVIRFLDGEIKDQSDVIPVLLKNGEIEEVRSSVASTKRFRKMQEFVKDKTKEVASEILDGAIAINPIKRDKKTGCDYCNFRSVCGFDKRRKGFEFSNLPKMSAKKVWEEIDGVDR